MQNNRYVLPVIVLSQFCCTSTWFAGNAVMADLVKDFKLPASGLGHLTSAIQFGFICGTLLFAFFTIADRYSPSKVFLVSSLLAATCNLAITVPGNTFGSLLAIRFMVGFFLAGIYPVGMKIAADHFEHGLGKSLGFLVGALVLGTSLPHLIKASSGQLEWRSIFYTTSFLAVFGGLLLNWLVPDGPYRKPGNRFDPKAIVQVFQAQKLRSAAFGYFGHMWELYAFWAFAPLLLTMYQHMHVGVAINVPLLSFLIIGMGGPACALAGYISMRAGAKRTATIALAGSGICCLLSTLVFSFAPVYLLVIFLLIWGMAVMADSPLFSTLVAQNAIGSNRGTALTIVNCIGFAITIVSIQLLDLLSKHIHPYYLFLALAPGPLLGIIALQRNPGKPGN